MSLNTTPYISSIETQISSCLFVDIGFLPPQWNAVRLKIPKVREELNFFDNNWLDFFDQVFNRPFFCWKVVQTAKKIVCFIYFFDFHFHVLLNLPCWFLSIVICVLFLEKSFDERPNFVHLVTTLLAGKKQELQRVTTFTEIKYFSLENYVIKFMDQGVSLQLFSACS